MTTMPGSPTPAEISATAIRILCREMGPVNTARFINQFTPGFGNYTEEREQLVGNPTVDELLAEIKRARRQNSHAKREKKGAVKSA